MVSFLSVALTVGLIVVFLLSICLTYRCRHNSPTQQLPIVNIGTTMNQPSTSSDNVSIVSTICYKHLQLINLAKLKVSSFFFCKTDVLLLRFCIIRGVVNFLSSKKRSSCSRKGTIIYSNWLLFLEI